MRLLALLSLRSFVGDRDVTAEDVVVSVILGVFSFSSRMQSVVLLPFVPVPFSPDLARSDEIFVGL